MHGAFPTCGCRPLKRWESGSGSSHGVGLTPRCPPWHGGEILLPSERQRLLTPGESLLLAHLAFIRQQPPGQRTNGPRDAAEETTTSSHGLRPRSAAAGWAGCGKAQSVEANAAVASCQRGRALAQGRGGHKQRGDVCTGAGLSGPSYADLAVHCPVSSGQFIGRASWREGLPGEECFVCSL